MQRLTKPGITYNFPKLDITEIRYLEKIQNRLAAYEDTGLEPEEIKNALDVTDIIPEINVTVDHIRDLIQAEQDGLLVVLPCKVGDTVYFTLLGRIIEKPVFSIVSFSTSARIYCAGTSEYFRPEDFGRTVFLTREEAEAAIAQEGDSE